MKLLLRDRNGALVKAWSHVFAAEPDVSCSTGDIFGVEGDALVSPANSFGYMDGGIDLAYLEHFGGALESRLQRYLVTHHLGELPVGQAVIIETLDDRLPFMVSAPTMRIPMNVAATPNAYLAMRAALLAVRQHNIENPRRIERLICPGLASAIGGMPAERVAAQMKLAWDVVVRGIPWPPQTGDKVLQAHFALVS